MRYKFYNNSERAWRAMYRAIEGAKSSVYLEMYIFVDDMAKYNFFELLNQKAKEGLRIRIVLDSVGSMDFSNNAIIELKKNGVEMFFFSHLLHRIHRKILVIDETRAFIGGVNFKQDTALWKDLMLEVKGPLVKNIIHTFAKVYVSCGGTDPLLKIKKKEFFHSKTRSWLVEHIPAMRKFILKKTYKESINNATKRIIIVTPYFAPKHWLRVCMHQAVLRGIEVEVLIPSYVDWFIPDRANYFYMYKMARLGVKFYMEKDMNHAKALLVDDTRALIGSQNIDFFSFDYNSEIGVFLQDAQAVKKLSLIIEKWKSSAVVFDYKQYKPRWYDSLLSPFMTIFAKFF